MNYDPTGQRSSGGFVRGTTRAREHAVLEKMVLSRDSDRWLLCCWDECDKHGYESNKAVYHDHPRGMPCNHPYAKHVNYVFCSDRHKTMFVTSHLGDYGRINPRNSRSPEDLPR